MKELSEIKIEILTLNKAIKSIGEVINLVNKSDNIIRDSKICRFRYTFNSFWKILQMLLEYEGFTEESPRECIMRATEIDWIANQNLWLQMLDDRNDFDLCYEDKIADNIYNLVPEYYTEMQKTYKIIAKRFLDKVNQC